MTAICNTLYFLGYPEWSEAIWQEKEVVLKVEDQKKWYKALHDLVGKHTKVLQPQRVLLGNEESKFKPQYYSDYFPCICELEGSDGNADHVIGLANHYIFDGSFEYALDLTTENLDICCSSDTEISKFNQIHYAVMYGENPNKKNKFMENIHDFLFE